MTNKQIVSDHQIIIQHNLDTVTDLLIHNLFIYLRDKYGCTYFTYMNECFITKKTIYFSNDPLWQEEYFSTGLANNCHIYKNAFLASGRNFNYVIWEMCPPILKDEKDINSLRESRNIANGIGFANQNDDYRESFSFATKKANKGFYKNFRDPHTISNILRDCK